MTNRRAQASLLIVPILISLVALGATLWGYTWVHIWYKDAVDYMIHRPYNWVAGEGRWINYLLFPILARVDGSLALYLNLPCLFLFAYIVSRRYIKDSAYSLAFAALCLQASPWVHHLTWPTTSLPASVMLAAAALSVRVFPIYAFYALSSTYTISCPCCICRCLTGPRFYPTSERWRCASCRHGSRGGGGRKLADADHGVQIHVP